MARNVDQIIMSYQILQLLLSIVTVYRYCLSKLQPKTCACTLVFNLNKWLQQDIIQQDLGRPAASRTWWNRVFVLYKALSRAFNRNVERDVVLGGGGGGGCRSQIGENWSKSKKLHEDQRLKWKNGGFINDKRVRNVGVC